MSSSTDLIAYFSSIIMFKSLRLSGYHCACCAVHGQRAFEPMDASTMRGDDSRSSLGLLEEMDTELRILLDEDEDVYDPNVEE